LTTPLRLADLLDISTIQARLAQAGLAGPVQTAKSKLFADSAGALLAAGVDQNAPLCAFLVPGRIEVLGKHTDYPGGRTMVVAVDQGFCILAAPRRDNTVRVFAAGTDQPCTFAISPEIEPVLGHWSNYPMTVARRLAGNFPGPLCGADIAFASDLPLASGMSSSSAFMIAVYLPLAKINQLDRRRAYRDNITTLESLAGYLATIENGQSFGSLAGDKGVGTFGGSEDHIAILCCRAGSISQCSYSPVRFERFIELPSGYVFAVASSGVVAEKTGAAREKYNRASALAGACARLWREATDRNDPHLAAALASAPDAGDRLRDILRNSPAEFTPEQLSARFEHFRSESDQIVPQAGDALAVGDLDTFTRFVDLSQALAETLLGTQVPETIHLARAARRLGAVAASAFGAGFGGSVWALVPEDNAAQFLQDWSGDYQKTFPDSAAQSAFLLTHPAPAARELLW